jgi:hypothetical protein
MTWLPIESRMITSIAYDAEKRSCICDSEAAMFIATSSRRLRSIRLSFDAESRGRFFLAHMRDRFRYQCMAKLQAA